MKKQLLAQPLKSVLSISVIALSALAVPQVQADTTSTNYPGLMCQPHDPKSALYAYGTFTDIYSNELPGNSLGMNCSIPRDKVDKQLNSVTVIVSDSDASLTDPNPNNSGTFCHTHNETLNAGSIDYAFGPYANTYNANGLYNAVTVAGPGVPVSPTSNFNLHCHIGVNASLHNYTANVRR